MPRSRYGPRKEGGVKPPHSKVPSAHPFSWQSPMPPTGPTNYETACHSERSLGAARLHLSPTLIIGQSKLPGYLGINRYYPLRWAPTKVTAMTQFCEERLRQA
jgi:hypothetical protein